MLTTLTKFPQARNNALNPRRRAIPEYRDTPEIELRIRYLLRGHVRLEAGLARTLLEFDKWLATVEASGLEAVLDRTASKQDWPVHDLIDQILGRLTADTGGIERGLLRKSLVETLLPIGGIETTWSVEWGERLTKHLRQYGAPQVLVRFLSLHVFNVVWFQIGDAIRMDCPTNDAFLETMERLEQACSTVVKRFWEPGNITRPLSPSDVRELIDRIAGNLCGF